MYSISCGAYDLHEVIGEGGMAQVWRGVHRAKGVPVAVKVVTAGNSLEAAYVDSFEREVQAVAALNHPGIVRVFDYGRISEETARGHESLAAGSPYLVMELFEAGPLEPGRAITSWAEVCDFAFALLDALAHAHARGVIHRDIKPDNILCDDAGSPTQPNRNYPNSTYTNRRHYKLSDFGLAHAAEEGVGEAVSAGTPQYMPPEQLTGRWRDFGPWTDLYALGCLLYELVCGRLPFDHEKLLRIVHMQMHEPLPPIEPRFAVPAGLEAFLRRMVAKEPAKRFRRAADAAFALAQLEAPVARVAAPPIGPPPSQIDTDADTLMDTSPEAYTALHEGHLPTRVSHDTMADLIQTETTRGMATLPLWEGPLIDASAPKTSPDTLVDVEAALSNFEPPPPLPESWRLAEPEQKLKQLDGTGLELFGLRALPFAGRQLERDEMWRVFREVFETQGLRVVSLRGPAGIGKSSLAEWMSHRVEEMGAANALKALHSSRSGANEGVPAMLERYFGVWHCSRQQIYERIVERLEYVRPTSDGGADADVEQAEADDELARALTEIIRPAKSDTDDDGPTYQFSSHGERYATVRKLLERLGSERPVLMWLDDAVRSQMALGFVRYLMEHDSTLPILIVLTSSNETATENTVAAGYLREIEEDDRVDRLDLRPMDTAAMGELIGQALRLDDALVARLQRRAQGLPLYVTQLLGDWVSQGALVDGEAGFRLREDGAEAFPVSIAELWDRRIERLLGRFDAARRDGFEIALELAATLGHQIDQAEWLAACEARGISGAKQLLAAMFDENLARLTAPGALFAHELLTDRLVQRAQEAGRTRQNHRACARALEQVYPPSDVEAAVRSARHLMDAHALDDALDKLEATLLHLRESGDASAAMSLLDRCKKAADRLGLDENHRRRARHAWLRGHFLLMRGELREAQRCAQQAIESAERHEWHNEAGHARIIEGRSLMGQLELDAAMESYKKATRHFEATKDREGLARAKFGKGVVHTHSGEHAAAKQCFKEAAWCAELVDDGPLRAKSLVQLGTVLLAEGDPDEAFACTEQAYKIAEQAGARASRANAARHLGEIARLQKDWETARRWLQEAYDATLSAMMFVRHYDRLNLALVDLDTEHYERADTTFGELRDSFAQAQDNAALPLIDLARVLCAVALDRQDQYLEELARVADNPAPAPNMRRDMAAIAEKAAKLAEARGWDGVGVLRGVGEA
ncbi:tetratricopeptide repeat protein [Persicimonas caeni]|uniref:Tetratricopeptide repeat protein n=1 Tax=Persicimonas caeni TaxID=2292766 RepID=A0A4Y6PST4_PERCE|nr:protein kinase [Persicimonas caeni]QDG51392.1 tetratricopeptide repeat protein [Persicimonas caeni]QED32613.1 protein kinase [Persicimonas caeni]